MCIVLFLQNTGMWCSDLWNQSLVAVCWCLPLIRTARNDIVELCNVVGNYFWKLSPISTAVHIDTNITKVMWPCSYNFTKLPAVGMWIPMDPFKASRVLAAPRHGAARVHHKADASPSSGDFLCLAYYEALCIHALSDCGSARRGRHVLLGC